MKRLYQLARPAIFRLDPERAHGLSLAALKRGLVPRVNVPVDDRLRVKVAGIAFPNPLGLAAGYDKNAEVPDAALRLGFGFAEVGTLTPQPQEGNPKPRIFRLEKQHAVINRLGFNNEGHADAAERLEARARKLGIIGVNVGANKDSDDRVADYVEGVNRFEALASYLTINISSPNTPGLRAFQSGSELDRLLVAVIAARDGYAALSATARKPLFVKVAPDLAPGQVEEIAAAVIKRKVDGLIVSNTTLSRPDLGADPHLHEAGGLSGRPLMALSTYVLAQFRKALGADFPLIGVGGVDSAATAVRKIEAGADLVQLYTGLVYGGPELPARILTGMLRHLERTGTSHIADIRDTRVDEILASPPPGAG
ncbi:quinone-dependent dihydroorotate dehydrogenase [Aurantimonas endophytica]|uniref:Dihydroorotate dehydrogenase (quinone) n=1 Tax=Aurantimonas endophytica TaxID=1522175 RepID=A0A7W6HEV5_9HYPH|nr:quinone-dependent dihydroorotate dehydrogenase [Aurantimonas endophytica]MBB4003893.1 dihydroorotate dehydrogenase [Aurantimonas endophytica]MCO6404744.1 quinone-dependent dihydroorotate dehydrogenase [Aurantimonas endophytica]